MIRILHVGLSENPGGVENLVINFHRNVDREQINFDYLDIYGNGIAFMDEIQRMGGTVYQLPNYKKYPFKAIKRMGEILDNKKFDIVHIHMQSAANIFPVYVSLKREMKIIAHSHSSSTPKGVMRKILNIINVKWLRKQDIIKWACGERAGQWMWKKDFEIIPNAIEYNKYKRNQNVRTQIREKCGFSEKDKVLGFVGRFGSEKNTFFIIKVFKELCKYSDDYKLLTVGGNDLYDEFCKKIKEEKLDSFYYSAGIQSDVTQWYQAMDAFLLPSFFEGFPMVGVEAQAAGLKCYFSDRISKEIDITNSVEFLGIEKNDFKKWSKKIKNDLENFNMVNNQFPQEYRLEVVVKILEKKYNYIKMNKDIV